MAKQLNINLAMTADAGKAKAELQALQRSLDNLMMSANRNNTSLGLSKELSNATAMAAKLKVQLESATTSTGKLDLTQFNQQLNKSGLTLKDYRTALTSLGPQGSQAFAKLTQSIMQAEVPLRRSSALISNFATTLKNTARWQISSSVLHGFMGALQGAYGYAQDLNESLNNIRIVTGQSVEDMAKFADQANKAAKALSTTTTAYTDAALIYYQQGLKGKEVTERTDTTIKLANVSRQSAEEVSSQMTAIWNNFDDGTKKLEYYADVITALGAATASSSDEIAQGLQKFASVADTVGLSYEKATAALATVVAETRQSADVVGTAFKTMFARFQGLSLGETLEDGVDLNKYSKALATVGVSILDANGELRVMDDILDDTAEKWSQISEAQRVALAETVAGTRQYAQFMAIMNNYDKIQANQTLAANSEGTLQKQADIYAESWEAASKRVKAAAQGIYQDLIDDKFFISMLNTIEKIISFIDKLIENMGGLKGVLLTIGSLVTTIFGQQITATINNLANNIKMLTPTGRQQVQNRRAEANEELQTMAQGMTRNSNEGASMSEAYNSQAQLQQTLLDKAKSLTEEEQKQAQLLIDMNSALGEAAIKAGQEADEEEKITAALQRRLERNANVQAARTPGGDASGVAKAQKDLKAVEAMSVKTESAINRLGIASTQMGKKLSAASSEGSKDLQNELKGSIEQARASIASMPWDDIKTGCGTAREAGRQLTDEMAKLDAITDSLEGDEVLPKDQLEAALAKVQEIKQNLENIFGGIGATAEIDSITNLGTAFEDSGYEAQRAGDLAGQAADQFRANAEAAQTCADKQANLKNATKLTEEQIKKLGDTASSIGSVVSAVGQTFMSVASAMNAVKNIGNIWSDEDLSAGEKVLQTLMSMSTMLPLVTSAVNLSKMAWVQEAAVKLGIKVPADEAAAASGWAALGPGLLFVGIAAAIVGAIMLIAHALGSIDNNAKKAKRAAEAAESLGNAAQEAQDKADALRSAFDKYDSVVEKLKQCTKGTQEWKDALAEVNSTVMDIVQDYPELAGLLNVERQEGQLVITNAEEVMKAAQDRADTLRTASIGANARAADAQLTVDRDNLMSKSRMQEVYSSGQGGAYVDQQAVAYNMKRREVINNASEYMNLDTEGLKDLQTTLGMTDDEFNNFYTSLRDLASQSDNVAHQMENAAQLMAADALKDERYGEKYGENVANAIQTYTAEAAKTAENEIYQNIIDTDAANNSKGMNSSSTSQDIWNRYLTAIGANPGEYTAAKNQIQGTDSDRKYAYTQRGVSGEQTISIEEMANVIAAYEAMGQLGDVAQGLADRFANMDSEAREFSASLINTKDDLGNYNFNDVLKNLTEADLAGIGAGGDLEQILGMTPDDIEALATALNMSIDDFNDKLKIAAAEVESSMGDIGSDLSKTPKEAFDKLDLSKLTYNEQQKIAEAYKNIFESGGKEALNAADDFIQSFADEGLSDEVAGILSNMDWSDWDVDESIKEAFKNAEIEIPDGFDDFIAKMREANGAIKNINLTSFRETFGEIQKIIDGIEVGDTIKAEDYAKLGEGYEDYFQLMADGTYKLIGNAKAFTDAVSANQREELIEGLVANQANIDAGQAQYDSATNALNGRSSSDVSRTGSGTGGEGAYSTDFVKDQIAFLEQMGYNQDTIDEWKTQLIDESGEWKTVSTEVLDAIGDAVTEEASKYENWNDVLEQTQKEQRETTEALFSTATSMEDLDAMQQQLIDSGISAEVYTDAYTKQVHTLGMEAVNGATSIEQLKEYMNTYGLTAADVSTKALELTDNFVGLNGLFQEGLIDLEQYNQKTRELMDAMFAEAATVQDLDDIMSELITALGPESGQLAASQYSQTLIKFGEACDFAQTETYNYKEALENVGRILKDYDEDSEEAAEATRELAEAEDVLRAAIKAQEGAKKYGLDAKVIQNQAKAIRALNKDYAMSAEEATELAIVNQRMNKGVTALNKNFKDWRKTLTSTDKTSEDYAEAVTGIEEAISDLIGAADDFELPDGFLEMPGMLDKIQAASEGDITAINEIGIACTNAAIGAMELDASFAELSNITAADFENAKNTVLQGIDDITNHLPQLLDGSMSIQDAMGGTADSWVESLNQMAIATGMSVDQMNGLLNQLGVQAKVDVTSVPQEMEVPTYTDVVEPGSPVQVAAGINEDGTTKYATVQGYRRYTVPGEPITVQGYAQVAQISTVDGETPGAAINYTGVGGTSKGAGGTSRGGGVSPSSTGGGKGGGGGAKDNRQSAKEKKDVTEEKERYHWLNEELDDLSRAYDKASKAKDRLFGKDKIRAIKEEIQSLEKLIKHNQAYLKAIDTYRAKDKNNLLNGGLTKQWVDSAGDLREFTSHGLDIEITFDTDGNIENYDQVIEAAVAEYNAAVEAYNLAVRKEGVTEDEVNAAEDAFKQAEMQYELIMEALSKYEESNNLFQEKLEEIRDSFREIQDKRFEEWSYQLELKIKINEEDMRQLDYFRKHLQRFAKDAYAPITELLSIWNNNGSDSNWKLLQIGAADLKEAANSLLGASHGDPIIDSATGQLLQDFDYSQEDWMAGLDDLEDKIYAQIDALYELDETMSNYYSETLSAAEEKLDQYMTKMEDCTAVLKHFQTILELIGKEEDYEWMGVVLEGQRQTIQNELESATKEYELAKSQYDVMLERYERDKDKVDEGTRELMERELQAQYESMSKWQDKMLSKTEEYAEVLNAIYENTIKKVGEVFEKAATKGQGWDSMLASMDRVAAYQDLILTRTNQVYETNKLMRKLSQDIDKTESTAAKTKLANFKKEIQDMQDKNQMSKFDLDVANARYELLKAQIALEEAQNAKSIVRLQRDSEGNYGYVYTADQDKVDNAEQELEDKKNDLYNLTLNKANENARALVQLDQEMYAELERIAIEYKDDKTKMEEETNRVIEEYAQRRSVLVQDYALADYWQQQVSVTKTNEAYGDAYKQNLLDTNDWRVQVSDMVAGIDTAYRDWTSDMDTYVRPTVGKDLDELKQKTTDLTTESEKYQEWFDNFADTNAERLAMIAAITNEYFLQRQEVEALISDLEKLADTINNARADAAGMERGLTGSIGYDPNVDYSLLMKEYLDNGGQKTDSEYLMLQAQREAKISGMNLSQDYYGARGQEFENVLDYYRANNLEGYFMPAVTEDAAAKGIDVQDILQGNVDAQTANTEAVTANTEAVAPNTEAITPNTDAVTANTEQAATSTETLAQAGEETVQGISDSNTQTAEDIASTADEHADSISSSLDDATGRTENAVDDLIHALQDNAHASRDSAHEISIAVSRAAGTISAAISAIGAMASRVNSGAGGAIASGASGMYTGEWGSEGKLAVLHEKELVLNKEDTANMLATIDLVRQLSSAIDLRAGVSNFATNLISPSYGGQEQILEQEVTIHAEFPNAKDHAEIEEAFNSLINRATQYAARSSNITPKTPIV